MIAHWPQPCAGGCLRLQGLGVAIIVPAAPVDACDRLVPSQLQLLFFSIVITGGVDVSELLRPGLAVPDARAGFKCHTVLLTML